MRSLAKVRHTEYLSRTISAMLLFGSVCVAAGSLQAQIAPSAVKEINDIYAFKASLTPAERKMSTGLVLASRLAAGKPLGRLAKFYSAPQADANGRVLIELNGFATPSLLGSDTVEAFDLIGGQRPAANYQHAHLRAHVRANQLARLAAHPDVTSLREITGHTTNVGSITSQGYVSLGANKVVATGVTGANIKVGILSDSASATRVAALIASGDLPANTVVLPGQAGPTAAQGGEDEGTAMMEIVHDIAPGAQLFFATAFNSEASFAANIQTLRFTYGCDIIVDDVSYFDEPVFQDGTIAQAVNSVTANGALYFSASANSGNLTSGTSGTWEGDFTPGGTNSLINNLEGVPVFVNNFGSVTSPQAYDTLTSSPTSGVYLHWSDANGASSNDYDLFILNSTGTIVKGFGANSQTGTQDPFEFVQPGTGCGTATATGYCPAAGDRVVVALYNGAPRALHIDTERATLSIATSGATFGHNAGASTFSSAAVYWNVGRMGAKPFNSSNADETFSSDGPRKIFYNPDGTAITPGNFLFSTSGGTTLIKPDAAGPDGVSTATPGFNPFFGTSAAAPHLAAVAALVKAVNPALTNTQIRNLLTTTTIDNMAPGVDRDSGYGIVNAAAAVAAAKAMLQ